MARPKPVPHQATCVAIHRRGVLIEGPTGSGKSGLALSLIDRGAQFVGDDGVLVRPDHGRLIAAPHPRIRGLLEVRNLGLLKFPCIEETVIALVIRFDENASRYIEEPESIAIEGIAIPMVRFWPAGEPLAIKAELALEHYGLAV